MKINTVFQNVNSKTAIGAKIKYEMHGLVGNILC
jgi:hypothetical protein